MEWLSDLSRTLIRYKSISICIELNKSYIEHVNQHQRAMKGKIVLISKPCSIWKGPSNIHEPKPSFWTRLVGNWIQVYHDWCFFYSQHDTWNRSGWSLHSPKILSKFWLTWQCLVTWLAFGKSWPEFQVK